MNIDEIQAFLKENQIDGWLLYDFRGINPIAQRVAGMAEHGLTRRWFCYVPCTGRAGMAGPPNRAFSLF